jgi:DnaK suppressor protein
MRRRVRPRLGDRACLGFRRIPLNTRNRETPVFTSEQPSVGDSGMLPRVKGSSVNERTGVIMTTMTTTTTTIASVRHADLRQMLQDRRRETQNDVQSRIHEVRADGPNPVLDAGEHSEADIQDDIELALIQMRAETLGRIGEALVQLDAGEYGLCVECGEEISERRLRALPFAVRCTTCEERREQGETRQRRFAQRSGAPFLFADMASY